MCVWVSHYSLYRDPYLRYVVVVETWAQMPVHSSPMLLPDCPSRMKLAPTLSLAILEPPLNLHTHALYEQVKDDISTS